MTIKSCIATGAAFSLLASPLANALHPGSPGGLPRGARGTATRGTGQSLPATGAGFDLGEWLKQAFNPPTSAAVQKRAGASAAKKKEEPPAPRGCTNAVLVLGGTGKTGQKVVEALLKEGREVVVASRNEESAAALYDKSTPGLFMQSGVDVTDESTLKNKALFDGVSQVVSALGPRFGEEGSSSESVDFKGVQSAIEAAEAFLAPGDAPSTSPADGEKMLISAGGGSNGEGGPGGMWQPLDDVIMGGRSSSAWQKEIEGGEETGKAFGRWAGTLVTEGGGFCGTVIKNMPFDATGFDGVRVRVRGDGSRYKFRLKPDTELDNTAERQYQAAFDTVKGQWTEVDLPFESFVAVKRNYVDYNAPRVNEGPAGGKMLSLGLVLSRFGFNEYPNPKYPVGEFQLDVEEICLYKKPRPNFVLVSSASAERFHRLTEEERKDDIPIVALNPGGILNWKYKAETGLRKSALRHCVVRATGLIPEGKEGDESCRLQIGQGDMLSGRVARGEVAATVVAALSSPYSAGKTFELRRDEAEDATGKVPDFGPLFRSLVPDEDRSLVSAGGAGLPLPPFAIVQEPPPPVSEERKQEILNDPRVKAQQQQTKEGKEAAAAGKN